MDEHVSSHLDALITEGLLYLAAGKSILVDPD
jgi:hypothetical protein